MNLNVMPSPLRRWATVTAMAVALGTATLLAGCGSGSLYLPLVPTRMIVMGDGLADMGQVAGVRYTVNDDSINSWVQQAASNYGLTLSAQSAGGQNWARGNARVALKPDATGNAATLTITEQVDAFLAGNTVGKDDIVVLDAGISDLVALGMAFKAGSLTDAQLLANAADAGKALAAQARRLTTAGAMHILVAGTYNLGKSPFAAVQGLGALLETASLKYNEALLVAMVDLGANVLYIDAAFQYNLLINQPVANGFTNSTVAACTTPTAATCTTSTIGAGTSYNSYVFADDRYFTPAAQRSMGSYAYSRMKTRW